MKLIRLLCTFFMIGLALPLGATPSWVFSYGDRSGYSQSEYITGFASLLRSEDFAQQQVRDMALADLAGKISTRVDSELVLRHGEAQGRSSSSVSQVTRNSVNVTVPGADFEYHRDGQKIYALAFVGKESLIEGYANLASSAWEKIRRQKQEARQAIENHKTDLALEALFSSQTALSTFYEHFTLARSIQKNGGKFFSYIQGLASLAEIQGVEAEIQSLIKTISNYEAGSFRQAMNLIALSFKQQNVPGGNIQVPPLLFEASSLSSEFGRYAASRLKSALIGTLSPGTEKMIFLGQYWQENNKLRLIVLASDVDGRKFARSEVLMPVDATEGRSLRAQGFSDAMIALREFADGALSDGGINVDIWTNKGRNEEALVFHKDEVIQLYLRVNQPAYIQLSYRLATGEIILLEESFYIGSDRVNRTVLFPYDFEVVPPYGVENLIVTAWSHRPPESNTIPEKIDNQLYQVFSSVKEAVKNTRGIARRRTSSSEETRVGEAIITITTME